MVWTNHGQLSAPGGGATSDAAKSPLLYVPGRYIIAGRDGGTGSWSPGTPYSTRQWFMPLELRRSVSFDRIAVFVSTASATDLYRMGIYNASTTTGYPTTVAVDGGSVAVATGGVKAENTISVTLSAGRYWAAVRCNASATSSIRYMAGATEVRDVAGHTAPTATYSGPVTAIWRDSLVAPTVAFADHTGTGPADYVFDAVNVAYMVWLRVA